MNKKELKELKGKMYLVKKDLINRSKYRLSHGEIEYKHDVMLNDERYWVTWGDDGLKFYNRKKKETGIVKNFKGLFDGIDLVMKTNVYKNLYDFIALCVKFGDGLELSYKRMPTEELNKENKNLFCGNSWLIARTKNCTMCTMKFKCFAYNLKKS